MRSELLQFLGGSTLLIYSIGELSKSIQMLAGSNFRTWLNQSTRDRFRGMLLGGVLAALLCSSGAVTAMLVGLANSRLLSLSQTFAVSLGAGIGSTLMVQILAFKISEYGLGILAAGFVLQSIGAQPWMKRVGTLFLFVGMVFFSLDLLKTAGEALREEAAFQTFLGYFRDRPGLCLLFAAAFAALTQSSAATVAFAMSICVAQRSPLIEALPWVLGANLGTTATAYFASWGSDIPGKQAAMGSLLTKVAGVILFWPFLAPFASSLEWLGTGLYREIAMAHTLFNVAIALIFLPLLPWGVKLVMLLIPAKEDEGPFTYQFLDNNSLESPELALAQAQRELLRLSDAVERLLSQCLRFFQRGDSQAVEEFRANDKVIDFLNKGIRRFLTSLSQQAMTADQVKREFEILIRTNDMENIGDIVANSIISLVYKCRNKGYEFSDEGWQEIQLFHGKVIDCLRLSTAYFSVRTGGLDKQLEERFQEIERLSLELTERHLRRLHDGIKRSQDSSSVHLDLLGHLMRIASLSMNILRVRGTRVSSHQATG